MTDIAVSLMQDALQTIAGTWTCSFFTDNRQCSHSECAPGRTCPACGLNGFLTQQARNIHLMRRHADRRQAVIR